MEENVKKEARNITDEESAYPGTPLSSMPKFDVEKVIEDIKKHGKTDHLLAHSGYGHMSTTQLLALAKARKEVTIPNPNVNPQWSEIADDAIKFATTICMEEDIQKIQDALHEFIDVEDSHSKFIRKALARSILKTEMRCRVNSKIDCNKILDDREYSRAEVVNLLNTTYGVPKEFKCHPETSFASYVKYEEDEE